jgi:hypothetical protein
LDLSQFNVVNTIFYNKYDISIREPATASITYSVFKGSWEGEGNISLDPLFAINEDYHLLPSSPCIDAGIDAGIYLDRDRVTRPQGTGFDIGAYEVSN